MDWVRAHYERALLIAAAALLLVCSLSILRKAAGFADNFSAQQTAPPPRPATPPAKALELEAASKKLDQPPQWTASGGLFVAEPHFIGANGLPTTLKTTQVHPPVPNEWFRQFGLRIEDADVLEQDPDGDGFTNVDEWQGKSTPTDKNSRPDFVTKLKLKSFNEEPFRLKFDSKSDDTFIINTTDLKEPTQFLKIGDTIGGTKFKLINYTEKHEANPTTGGDVDVSELQLENQDTHAQLTLVKEKVAMSPESVATFVYNWPAGGAPQQFQVRKDQEFSLKPQEEIKYKLIDVQPAKAVIVNTQRPNDKIEIGLAAP